ncbi:hypothetical protein CNMCM5793_005838 [Aspergillus hiratsukae]|uniref:GPI-anchored cell wall protein Pst1 n=1 Tax=Aspergillus hiratsukae TaxID=1194566 RepID=A0A8H6PHM9_9EURO|nr:hypothetical protein CNMCM5793_005838 [Aspergillus hiratsukae]KAF7172404.1 hypothetical protein CNMCM6106_006594 [Aspergillus hiratsukae]
MKPLFFCLLLALRRVAADDDSNPRCNTNVNITSQADADSIASCQTVRGDVTITNSASGTINLHGVETIQGPLTADGTSNLSSLIASDLNTITGTLSVVNNGALNQISMSSLQTVGGDIKVENNQNLKVLSLSDLDEVRGGLTVAGDLNRISFSNLDTVRGPTTIHSSGTFNCSSLDRQQSEDHVFQSSYSCTTGNKSSSSGLGTGAKAGIAVAVVIVTLLILFFLWLFIRRRKRQQNRRTEKAVPEVATLPTAAPTGLATKTPKPTPEPTLPQENVERSILRKPLSPPPEEARSSVPESLLPGSVRMSVPVSLLAGSGPSVSSASASHQRVTSDPTLFLHHIPPPAPRPPPSEMDVPMLDSGNVYEAGTGRTRSQSPVYELDGGGMSNHQQPIHHD